jgi:hypothetical protein
VTWILVLGVFTVAWVSSYLWLNAETVSGIEVQNPAGEVGTALVVDHPGRGSFHARVVSGFVEGLVAGGWRVETITASGQAPTDLSGYDLLVLGSPTYWFAPSWPIRRYLDRLGDLAGQVTVIIITGMGAGERSAFLMQRKVQEANGELVSGLLFYRLRPNDDENYINPEQNQALAVKLATQAARKLAAAGRPGSRSTKIERDVLE